MTGQLQGFSISVLIPAYTRSPEDGPCLRSLHKRYASRALGRRHVSSGSGMAGDSAP
ncbi:hypothetical protein; RMQ11705 [Methylorubrum extorquens AM1]|uniref:Uncharacterized protein n=1 Tax=Methylorubrum extorquens (strain ATCC 14718 / DSM 1338 / JCM 2805 / NCIMB 9133 / AM1) TaxID=272630 RepID=C5B2U7_METEA|nr:hypothetical protein; RMQ11705 [Methylorubrum extorquens AM1]